MLPIGGYGFEALRELLVKVWQHCLAPAHIAFTYRIAMLVKDRLNFDAGQEGRHGTFMLLVTPNLHCDLAIVAIKGARKTISRPHRPPRPCGSE